jgi:kynurenine formamidase
VTAPSDDPAELDLQDPEQEIRLRAEEYRNWGRWGENDALGTLNFITESKRAAAAALVDTGLTVSLAQSFDMNGPQKGWRRRTNPVHTMLDTGTDAERGNQGFPHGLGGADDIIAMPLQCSTQWDGLGHIFDHGYAWNGRRAGDVVTSDGDLVTGIEHAASAVVSRGVLLDLGRHLFPESGELPDGFAITTDNLRSCVAAQGATSGVGTGDIVLVRTGQLARVRRDGWGDYAGGPAPGLSLTTVGWLHDTEIAAIATDTWGFEVRPNEFDVPAFQPLHQVAIPNLGLTIGEMWDLEELATTCERLGRYEFLLSAPPLPITYAVGSPINPIALL